MKCDSNDNTYLEWIGKDVKEAKIITTEFYWPRNPRFSP
jgi:hypothetical protein